MGDQWFLHLMFLFSHGISFNAFINHIVLYVNCTCAWTTSTSIVPMNLRIVTNTILLIFFLWYITHSECMVIEFNTITMGSCTRCDLVPRNPLIYTFITLSLCMQIACDTTNAIYKFNLVHADSLMLQDIGLDASISCFTANPQDNPKVTYIHFAESPTLSVN